MDAMNLREWKRLEPAQRKEWMSSRSPKDLVNLLIMIGEMLEHAAEMDVELSMLIEPSSDVTDARDSTYNALRSVERYVTHTIRERNIDIRKV
jgi:hypothetical protein